VFLYLYVLYAMPPNPVLTPHTLLQVIMATKESAERACKEPNPIIDGRKANVNLAILGAKPRGNLTGIFDLRGINI
jgi:hypothetical protein